MWRQCAQHLVWLTWNVTSISCEFVGRNLEVCSVIKKPQTKGCVDNMVVWWFIFRCRKMDVVICSMETFQSKEVSGEKWIPTRLIQVSDRHKYGRIVEWYSCDREFETKLKTKKIVFVTVHWRYHRGREVYNSLPLRLVEFRGRNLLREESCNTREIILVFYFGEPISLFWN